MLNDRESSVGSRLARQTDPKTLLGESGKDLVLAEIESIKTRLPTLSAMSNEELAELVRHQESTVCILAKNLFHGGCHEEAFRLAKTISEVCGDSDTSRDFCWGCLTLCILLEKWDEALRFFDKLDQIIETMEKTDYKGTCLDNVLSRKWQTHLGLFLFANHPDGPHLAMAHFSKPKLINMIRLGSHYFIRYLLGAALCITSNIWQWVGMFGDEMKNLDDPFVSTIYHICVSHDPSIRLEPVQKSLQADYFLCQHTESIIDRLWLLILSIRLRLYRVLRLDTLEQQGLGHSRLQQFLVRLQTEFGLDAQIRDRRLMSKLEP